MYEELEKHCDRVALIDKGKIVDIADMNEIRNRPISDYKVEFNKKEDYDKFKTMGYKIIRDQKNYHQVTVSINKEDINKLFDDLTQFDVKFLAEVTYTLEKHFKEKLEEFKKENKQ